VHRANTAFTIYFPAPWRPPHVWNSIGEKSKPHPFARVRALPAFLLPLVLQEGGRTASQGPAVDWVRVDDFQVQREVPLPIPLLEQKVRWATLGGCFFSLLG